MLIREGDIVGLVNNRFGRVDFIVTQNWFMVSLFPDDPEEAMSDSPDVIWSRKSEVASIV